MSKFRILAGVILAGAALTGLAVTAHAQTAAAKSYIVYVGTYTTGRSKGVYGYRLTPATGELAPMGLIQEAANPAWLAAHPNHRVLYVANEHPTKTAPGNTVSAYGRDEATGKLTLLNAVSTKGEGPAHISVDHTGKVLVAANFITGSVASFRILPDGKLSEAVSVIAQEGQAKGAPVPKDDRGVSPTDSHNHCAMISPDNRFVTVCNIGIGRIYVFGLNTKTGVLTPSGGFDVPPGADQPRARPRHMTFHPSGKYAYFVDSNNQVAVAAYDAAAGAFKALQGFAVATDDPGKAASGAEIQIDQAGKFVYTSGRGADETLNLVHVGGSLNVFAVDASTGKLTPVQQISTGGDGPRTFSLDPSGGYLFVGNRNSNNIVVFSVDRTTGRLRPTGKVLTDAPEASCFVFEAAQ